jgi:beta-lactamase superfamily II metal-dependent hydrolase
VIRSAVRANSPAADELEISVFGPGRGECVVAHVGNGSWIVVDSCTPASSARPVALSYLGSIGVSTDRVDLIVATHWDSDHIQGIADVLAACPNARFACSDKDMSLAMLDAVAKTRHSTWSKTGFSEFSRALKVLQDRAVRGQRKQSIGPTRAVEGTVLLARPATITALSPSSGTSALTDHELMDFLPSTDRAARKAVSVSSNERAVVLLVEAGCRSALLGSDLEQAKNPAVGWSAIVASPVRPQVKSEVFKVAHHGSSGADNPDVWTQMLNDTPIACLTPFAMGSGSIPRPADIRRLLLRSNRIYCAFPPRGLPPPKRDPTVERMAREVAHNRRVAHGEAGQIRVRCSLASSADPATVDLFGPAFQCRAE